MIEMGETVIGLEWKINRPHITLGHFNILLSLFKLLALFGVPYSLDFSIQEWG